MKIFFNIILLFFLSLPLVSQDDDNGMEQEQWEAIRDKLAVDAIKLLARLDTLKGNIDSLKSVLDYVNSFDYEEELYKSIGATKEEVADFRSKFIYTEEKISKREGTPKDIRQMYFDEISSSKLRCLPEFMDRFMAMNISIFEMNNYTDIVIPENITDSTSYIVIEGDNLRNISAKIYGSSHNWHLIWEANKYSVLNSDELVYDFILWESFTRDGYYKFCKRYGINWRKQVLN